MVAYSIPKQKRMPAKGQVASADPGPGNYAPKPDGGLIKPYAPQWRIGSETREKGPGKNKIGSPGPGTYGLPSLLTQGPKWFMAQKTKKQLNQTLSPGPGWYESKTTKSKISYSMGLKVDLAQKTDMMNKTMPGPGQYSPRSGFYSSCMGKIGTDQRRGAESKSNYLGPGPGTYDSKVNLDANYAPKFGFGTAEKFFDSKQKEKVLKAAPGPGSYQSKKIIGREGKSYTMGDNKPTKGMKLDTTPGPGTYQLKLNPLSPQYRIGTSKRADTEAIKFNASPAPGLYSPKDTNRTTNPNWRFGSQQRKGYGKSQSPGPGTYESPDKAVQGQKYSFGLKIPKKTLITDPGPGQYQPESEKVKDKAPAFVLGTGPKMGRLDRGTCAPGPGSYSPKNADGTAKFGFGSSVRDKGKPQPTPGPGHYKIPIKFQENPEFQLRKVDDFKYV